MKNVFKMIGVITVMAIIGFSFAACGGGDDGDDDIGLDGVWRWPSVGIRITVKGNKGVWTDFPTYPDALTQSSMDKGYIKKGGTFWKDLTSTGSLKYSGQQAMATYNSSAPNVATGTSWGDRIFTLSADGKTLTVTTGSSSVNWTKE